MSDFIEHEALESSAILESINEISEQIMDLSEDINEVKNNQKIILLKLAGLENRPVKLHQPKQEKHPSESVKAIVINPYMKKPDNNLTPKKQNLKPNLFTVKKASKNKQSHTVSEINMSALRAKLESRKTSIKN